MRDAGEAQRHRIEALERALEDSQLELEQVRRLSTSALELEAERARLARENEVLRGSLAPLRRAVALALGGAVAFVAAIFVAALTWRSARDEALAIELARVEHESAMDRARIEQEAAARAAALAAQLAEAELRATAAETESSIARQRADTFGQVVNRFRPETTAIHRSGGWRATGRVEQVTGRELPPRCEIEITATPIQCLARVRCGEGEDAVELYPHPGRTGWVPNCTSDASGLRRALDGRITESDGDPSLELDVAERTLVVADRGWRAEISLIGP